MDVATNMMTDMNKTLTVFMFNRVLLNMFLKNPIFKMSQRWTSEIFASYLGIQLYHQIVHPRLVIVSNLVSNLVKVCVVTFINALLTDGFKPRKFFVLIIITILYSLFIEQYASTKIGSYLKNQAHANALVESVENSILLSIDDGSKPIEMVTSTLSIFAYYFLREKMIKN